MIKVIILYCGDTMVEDLKRTSQKIAVGLMENGNINVRIMPIKNVNQDIYNSYLSFSLL